MIPVVELRRRQPVYQPPWRGIISAPVEVIDIASEGAVPVTIDYDTSHRIDLGAGAGLAVPPQQFDEFVCTRCVLVHHRHNMADEDARVCFDCS